MVEKTAKSIRIVIFLGFIFLVSITGVNIFMRYFFGSSFAWIDEVSRLVFVWITFLSIAEGVRLGIHPGFTSLKEKSPKKVKKILNIIILALELYFLILLLYGGIRYVLLTWAQKMSTIPMSLGWKYLSAPIATFLMLLFVIASVLRKKRGD